jgi:hypothetical protein
LRFINTNNFSQHYTQTQRLTEANLIEFSFDVKWRGMDGDPPAAHPAHAISVRVLEGSTKQHLQQQRKQMFLNVLVIGGRWHCNQKIIATEYFIPIICIC